MFREELHNDIDGITPSSALLDKVSLMMKEEAERKKPKLYITALRYGSIAAAVCIATAVAVVINTSRGNGKPEIREASTSQMVQEAAPELASEEDAHTPVAFALSDDEGMTAESIFLENEPVDFLSDEEYENYVSAFDRSTEKIIFTDEDFRGFIDETYETALNFSILFEEFIPFETDTEIEAFVDEKGDSYTAFLTERCHSLEDLWDYMGEYYSEDIVEMAREINSDHGFIIEAEGHIYERDGNENVRKGGSLPETARPVYQNENNITASIDFDDGERHITKHIFTVTSDGEKWKYNEWML